MGLAGRREKQRISVDPQNRQWADDKSKIGYKMMQAMGWSGKGLGKNEDGMAEHVKVSLKSNNLGIGADKKSSDNWMDNTFAFSSLLENLNQTVEAEGETTTIEETTTVIKKKKKSKKSSKGSESEEEVDEETTTTTTTVDAGHSRSKTTMRMAHRRKFHMNKNVAGYSTDELNKILGVKPSSSSSTIEELPASPTSNEPLSESAAQLEKLKESASVNTRTATVDLSNYFASKMPSALLNSGRSLLGSTRQEENDDEEDERPSFGGLGLGSSSSSSARPAFSTPTGLGFGRLAGIGMSSFVKATVEPAVQEEEVVQEAKKEKKKKSKKADDEEESADVGKKEKKKKSKKAVEDVDQEEEEKPKKKKKSKRVEEDEEVVPTKASKTKKESDDESSKKDKKKKKRKEVEEEEAEEAKPAKKPRKEVVEEKEEETQKPKKNKVKRDKWGNKIQ